ncbi:peptide ABC transporter permease [Bacillus thuringiensis]|uniref:Binding-protein-dependent transport system inner membrane protein n=1 Tax=Bacillus thuringiensis YBT-1518 TaxID=529122 RepID=A0A9W3PDQ9_BACTU|nr:ABC transporter permease [Bacillus thuringiensis]AHA69410.1 binding-protein-dependent transport system inner membrane protein [Bacillus thuringiensis YBT-1518]MBG9486958.1 peptide ABC transporter permease [Bacillus thuringiensis]
MYVIKKLSVMVFTLWVITTVTFLIMHIIPGDPFSSDAKIFPEEVIQNMRAKYHLDEPLWNQYVAYLDGVVHFDFGESVQSTGQGVSEIITTGFGPSAIIGLQALVISLLVGIAAGTFAALYHGRVIDYSVSLLAILGISIPSFILAPLFIQVFAIQFEFLPVASWGTFEHTVLPSFALALGPIAVLQSDYIKLVRAKGIPIKKIIIRHALRNAIVPVLTFVGPLMAGLLTGTFVIEKIFSIPGLGKYFVDSIFNRDYPVIMGTTIFYSALLIACIFITDIIHRIVDPRIRSIT